MSVTSVPLLDLRRGGPELDEALKATFARVLESGHYIMGPEVDAFEKECAAYVGAKHALGVSSGTDALLLAMMALGIGPGDEVICPTYSFFATAGCVARLGAKPVFVDVEPRAWNIDAAQVAKAITPRTKAIMPVHLFGQLAQMGPLVQLSKQHNIPIIEDAAQAIGSEGEGMRAGTVGTFGCFSFFPSKNLGAFGDAGLVTTDDDALAEKARILRVHGGKPKYYHQVVGANFRIDALQAALLRVKLPKLDAATAQRQKNAAYYTRSLAHLPGLMLPEALQSRHIYNQFVLRLPGEGRRDALQAHLKARGVGSEVYYPVPLHLQKCFENLGHKVGDFPVAEAAAKETLAIPIFPELTEAELAYVSAAIVDFCTSKS
jgi:dTDP-4-amino-4,6-dideoxygalactose transaminase